MNSIRLRQILTYAHLWIAGLVAPIFLIVAISGGLYAAGVKPTTHKTDLGVVSKIPLDLNSDALDSDVRSLFARNNIDVNFEYLKIKDNKIYTRPMSRTFVTLEDTAAGVTAQLQKPSLLFSLLELHKGHGPLAFRYYLMFVAICLILSVFGGVIVGALAKTYRTQTLSAVGIGTILALYLSLGA